MAGQRHPKGPTWPTDARWKADVLRLMAELQISRAELARRVGVSDAAITQLFRSEQQSSRLVPAINRVIGMPPPALVGVDVDAVRAELDAEWQTLDDASRQLVLDVAKKLARTKR